MADRFEPTRRELLTGGVSSRREELHISSLVVHARPEALDGIRAAMAEMAGVEIHAATAMGKLVITLETPDESEIVTRVNEISLLDGVMSATLVYHQYDQDQQSSENAS